MSLILICLFSLLLLISYHCRLKKPLREIAITIDDVPIDRTIFEKIINHLKAYNAPATMFAIANRLNEDEYAFLLKLKSEQFVIGSHTYSHKNLSVTSVEEFNKDIRIADEILSPLLSERRYFRYPYLAMGKGFKKFQVMKYLKANNYTIAPVTVRSLDVRLDRLLAQKTHTPSILEDFKQQYLDYVWKRVLKSEKKYLWFKKKQILLIHANSLNGYFLGDLLKMLKDNGYRFITMDAALGFDKKAQGRNN